MKDCCIEHMKDYCIEHMKDFFEKVSLIRRLELEPRKYVAHAQQSIEEANNKNENKSRKLLLELLKHPHHTAIRFAKENKNWLVQSKQLVCRHVDLL